MELTQVSGMSPERNSEENYHFPFPVVKVNCSLCRIVTFPVMRFWIQTGGSKC